MTIAVWQAPSLARWRTDQQPAARRAGIGSVSDIYSALPKGNGEDVKMGTELMHANHIKHECLHASADTGQMEGTEQGAGEGRYSVFLCTLHLFPDFPLSY